MTAFLGYLRLCYGYTCFPGENLRLRTWPKPGAVELRSKNKAPSFSQVQCDDGACPGEHSSSVYRRMTAPSLPPRDP